MAVPTSPEETPLQPVEPRPAENMAASAPASAEDAPMQPDAASTALDSSTVPSPQGQAAGEAAAQVADEDEDDELARALEAELFRDEEETPDASAAEPVAAVPPPEGPDASAAEPADTVPPPPALPAEFARAPRRPEAPDFVDESRYTQDDKGVQIHKWKVEYASRGGGGRATCRDLECLHREEQAGIKIIEKGALRICRRVCQEKDGEKSMILLWYHARCMFNTFRRAKKTTRIIESPEDLEGFESIAYEDQQWLRQVIAGTEDVRGGSRPSANGAALKRTVRAADDTPAAKKLKLLEERPLKPGERVWTFCKVRPKEAPPGAAPAGAPVAFSVKSKKPELGMIREEIRDGRMVVQFESAEHEKDRIEKMGQRKFQKVRGWLRYPRLFEGKKQTIPVEWIQVNRTPPRLCSCTRQEWGHYGACGEISCGRGTTKVVFGVQQ